MICKKAREAHRVDPEQAGLPGRGSGERGEGVGDPLEETIRGRPSKLGISCLGNIFPWQ